MLDAARLKRLLPYAVVAAGAAYLYAVAADIRYPARAGVLGPNFWPQLILALMLAVCAWKVVAALVRAPGRRAEAAAPADEAQAESHPWLLVGGMVLSVAYVWALPRLGFFSASVPYLATFIALGGYRRWGVVAALSLAGTLLMVFFFMKVVYVSLPLGQGPFRQVTLGLMQLMGIR